VLDDAVYYDSILSHSRETIVTLSWKEVDYGSLGWLREAEALVVDKFQVRTLRIEGVDTTEYDHERHVVRIGFFLKIGSDAQAYVGWQLWGMAIDSSFRVPVMVRVNASTGASFAGDESQYVEQVVLVVDSVTSRNLSYVKLSDLPVVPDASTMVVETTIGNPSAPARYYQHLSSADTGGFFTRPMMQIDRDHYVDTIRMPGANPRLYDVVLMQSFVDTTFRFSKAWVFPFKTQ
jgi:hypothetical protein